LDSKIGWMLEKDLYSTQQWNSIQAQQLTSEDKPADDKYAILAQGFLSKIQAVVLRSSYLQMLYHRVADFVPGVSYDNEEVSFGHPFQPLFYYLEDIVRCAEKGKPQATAEAKPDDVKTLVRFYDKWIRPAHNKIRANIADGTIKFEDLWAIFKPGEILSTKDELGMPQLFRVAASAYRHGGTDVGDDNGDNSFAAAQAQVFGASLPTRFCFDCWQIKWDHSTKKFTRAPSTLTINKFRGTRRITSLPFYPLRHSLSDESSRMEFLQKLETRGRAWKKLASGSPVCSQYDGPAMELERDVIDLSRSAPINVCTAHFKSSEHINDGNS
jgi:hypothetical protein